jgi:hypothetical protein
MTKKVTLSQEMAGFISPLSYKEFLAPHKQVM